MKKTLLKSLALVAVGSLLVAGSALATSISYTGGYSLSNLVGSNAYDKLSFESLWGMAGSGSISPFVPADDGLFFDAGAEYIGIADLTLVDGTLNFSQTIYVDGFKVYDNDATLLFEGDLEAISIVPFISGGSINSAFVGNVTNISSGSGYVLGTSAIVDSFVLAPAGAMNITLQFAGDLASLITTGGVAPTTGTYSGTAAPVPEPATMLLFGTGLIGLAGASRRRKVQK